MHLGTFFHPHIPVLVILAITLAILASFVSLELAGRIKAANGHARFAWLLAAGIAMGGGIWSMHFVAMIAIELPFAIAYDLRLTLLSLILSILVATIGFYTVFWNNGSIRRIVSGGAIMGMGVALMHYIGMAALIMPAVIHYDFRIAALSVLIAIAASIAALWLSFQVERLTLKLASAVLMGFAVSAMHFTGIAALTCGPALSGPPVALGLSTTTLAAGVTGTSGIILLIGLGLAIADRRAKRRAWAMLIAQESKRRIDALLRNTADLIAVVNPSWIVTYMSRAADSLAGLTAPAPGMDFLPLFAPSARRLAFALMDSALTDPGKPVRAELPGTENATKKWFEVTLNDQSSDKAIQGIIVNLRDITEQKRSKEQTEKALEQAQEATRIAKEQTLALEHAHEKTREAEEQARLLARHDALTGLPNRRVFTAELQSALSTAQSGSAAYSVLLLDVDEFKKINDLQGHQAGDLVLCANTTP